MITAAPRDMPQRAGRRTLRGRTYPPAAAHRLRAPRTRSGRPHNACVARTHTLRAAHTPSGPHTHRLGSPHTGSRRHTCVLTRVRRPQAVCEPAPGAAVGPLRRTRPGRGSTPDGGTAGMQSALGGGTDPDCSRPRAAVRPECSRPRAAVRPGLQLGIGGGTARAAVRHERRLGIGGGLGMARPADLLCARSAGLSPEVGRPRRDQRPSGAQPWRALNRGFFLLIT